MSVTAMKGTAVSHPGVETYRVTSLCAMPRTRPAMVVMGNEENPPITAAARMGMTMRLRFSALRVVIGYQEDGGQSAQGSPDGPVGRGDQVRRDGQGGRRGRVLGHRRRGQAERRVLVDRPEHHGEHDHDAEDPEPVLADGGPEDGHRTGRERGVHRAGLSPEDEVMTS